MFAFKLGNTCYFFFSEVYGLFLKAIRHVFLLQMQNYLFHLQIKKTVLVSFFSAQKSKAVVYDHRMLHNFIRPMMNWIGEPVAGR